MKKKKLQGSKPEAISIEDMAAAVAVHREAGTQQFLQKNYHEAIDEYEQALKLLGDCGGSTEQRAELLQKTAGCYIIIKK
jgi:hypothetical protein